MSERPHPQKRHQKLRQQPSARRRRQELIRRRQQDLRQDIAAGVLLAIFVLSAAAGLGVVALLCIPVALGLAGSLVLERRLRRRDGGGTVGAGRPSRAR